MAGLGSKVLKVSELSESLEISKESHRGFCFGAPVLRVGLPGTQVVKRAIGTTEVEYLSGC